MEQVLVVKTAALAPWLRGRRGLLTDCVDEVLALAKREHEFLPRDFAEEHPEYRQIIPYVTVCRGAQVFATRRLDKGGEARLRGLLSLGLGGHINPDADGTGAEALENGLRRELSEEIALEDFGDLRLRGLINDDGNEVGAVHLGFFYTLTTTGSVRVRETEKLAGTWLRRDELWAHEKEMETWSQMLLPQLAVVE